MKEGEPQEVEVTRQHFVIVCENTIAEYSSILMQAQLGIIATQNNLERAMNAEAQGLRVTYFMDKDGVSFTAEPKEPMGFGKPKEDSGEVATPTDT